MTYETKPVEGKIELKGSFVGTDDAGNVVWQSDGKLVIPLAQVLGFRLDEQEPEPPAA